MARRTTRLVAVLLGLSIVLNSVTLVVAVANNAARVHQIQQERVDAIVRGCEDQNRRHDATIIALRRVAGQASLTVRDRRRTVVSILGRLLGDGPDARSRVEAVARLVLPRPNAASTVLLISALVPKQDCVRIAHAAVPSH